MKIVVFDGSREHHWDTLGSDAHHSSLMPTTWLQCPPLRSDNPIFVSGTHHSAPTPTSRLQHKIFTSSTHHSTPATLAISRAVVFDASRELHWDPLGSDAPLGSNAHHFALIPTTQLRYQHSALTPTTRLQRSPLNLSNISQIRHTWGVAAKIVVFDGSDVYHSTWASGASQPLASHRRL